MAKRGLGRDGPVEFSPHLEQTELLGERALAGIELDSDETQLGRLVNVGSERYGRLRDMLRRGVGSESSTVQIEEAEKSVGAGDANADYVDMDAEYSTQDQAREFDDSGFLTASASFAEGEDFSASTFGTSPPLPLAPPTTALPHLTNPETSAAAQRAIPFASTSTLSASSVAAPQTALPFSTTPSEQLQTESAQQDWMRQPTVHHSGVRQSSLERDPIRRRGTESDARDSSSPYWRPPSSSYESELLKSEDTVPAPKPQFKPSGPSVAAKNAGGGNYRRGSRGGKQGRGGGGPSYSGSSGGRT